MLAALMLSVPVFAAGFVAAKMPARAVAEPVTSREPVRAGEVARTTVALSGSATARGLYRNHTASYWAARYRHRTRQYQNARRQLMARPSVSEAINLAATIYGHGAELWRKARCESGLNPNARNGSEASGLLQFLPSTWRTTPFAGFSIFSPYANALAAGWMHARGRGAEWACH